MIRGCPVFSTFCLGIICDKETNVCRQGRHGRQKKRWEGNIREWPGLEFAKSQRAVENGKMEETGCELICGAPTTLAVKG